MSRVVSAATREISGAGGKPGAEPTARGLFVAVVGPSGAGKDTLLRLAQAELAGDSRFRFVRRAVTRAPNPHEDHATLDGPGFEAAERSGAFALAWAAHGLRYGVPREAVHDVADGRIAVCNLSRAAVAEARRVFGRAACVLVTAPPETLAARIAARGRDAEVESRAPGARDGRSAPRRSEEADTGVESDFAPDLVILNDATPEGGGAKLAAALRALADG